MRETSAVFEFLKHLRGVSQEDFNLLVHELAKIVEEDESGLKKAAASYGDSWKSRGGVGAFMQFCRKFDRMQNALDPDKWPSGTNYNELQRQTLAPMSRWNQDHPVPAWDIFAALQADRRPEGILDDVRDLRRYLTLVEAEMRARGIVQGNNHRDNK